MAKIGVHLDSLSVGELNSLIEEAKARLEAKKEGARAALIEEMTSKAAELGLSLDALLGKQAAPQTTVRKVRGDTGQSVAIKYKGPNDATWTGRGRMPRWLTEAVERGAKKQDFAV
ncbi:H-NS histone family protein [Roseomonas nepalensis]|uniref:H-NS histone family protein n=1 Tax=Muricoccus nepalensis TaxID=1854500 RepID=A0A502FVU2_9PROT|nr:H-NS histone family protein [Roseomonas nepalensis]TPG53648.1 H-NS histone family protein [Roseomonas nepalensis]